jgi:hypothetical protein
MEIEPPDMPDDLYREFEHTGDIGIEVEGGHEAVYHNGREYARGT